MIRGISGRIAGWLILLIPYFTNMNFCCRILSVGLVTLVVLCSPAKGTVAEGTFPSFPNALRVVNTAAPETTGPEFAEKGGLALLLANSSSGGLSCHLACDGNLTSALSVINGMLEAIGNSKQFTYKIKSWERFGTEMIYCESDVRMQVKPYKVYLKTWAPEAGIEILYAEGERDGLALIKPSGFPYLNVKLDPGSSRMREDQHHTILESGFGYFGGIIRRSLDAHQNDFERYVTLEDGSPWQGKACYLLTIDHPAYAWISYTVKPGETILSIARRNGLPEHSIMERNPSLDDYSDVKPGEVIRIPNAYASKTVLYIDKQTLIPIKKLIYDDRGLYERYEFHYLNAAPGLGSNTFNPENPEYGF